MDKNNNELTYKHSNDNNTAKVLYIRDYLKKRESQQNTQEDPGLKTMGKTAENTAGNIQKKVTYLDEERQKTLDLFAKVLHTMKKEGFQ